MKVNDIVINTWIFLSLKGDLQRVTIFEPAEGRGGHGVGLALQGHLSVQQHRHVLGCTLPCYVGRNWFAQSEKNVSRT